MAKIDVIMPKMGESILEATILKWVKNVGDTIELEETLLEIATDKVDSEVPAPADGVLTEIRFQEDEVVPIGTVIAVIETENDEGAKPSGDEPVSEQPTPAAPAAPASPSTSASPAVSPASSAVSTAEVTRTGAGGRFYSPLVRNIAKAEGVSMQELDQISGSGHNGRVTKRDMLAYLDNRGQTDTAQPDVSTTPAVETVPPASPSPKAPAVSSNGQTEIVEMDRMRKIIAKHMVDSKHTSPHVTSFVEVDITNIVQWRSRNKKAFQERYGEKITFTPIFIEAVVRALHDFPMVNISVDGDKLVIKKNLNIGMAAALPSGNLIVPVIHQADQYSLAGLAKKVNDLAARARSGKLKAEEIQGGTFTVTNVGTFGNVMGTPIINQPQVAILAVGAIRKKPAVVETEHGDFIGIRQMMFLSLSYDHRVVDGFLGGSFLRKIGDYLESFDPSRSI